MRILRIPVGSIVLAFVVFAILWKGGKALDAVWLQALLASGAALLSVRKYRASSLPPALVCLLLGLTAWTLLSFFFSTTKNYGFDELLQTVSLSLLCLWVIDEQTRNEWFKTRFAQCVASAALIACAIGIGVYILQPVTRFVGTFFDYRFHTDYWPNAWAEFLLFAWPLALWCLFSMHTKKKKSARSTIIIKSAALGLLLGCLFLSYSRGGFIAFSGQLGLLAALVALFFRSHIRWSRGATVVGVTLVVSLLVFAGINSIRVKYHDVESTLNKVTFTAAEGTSSVSERKEFWVQSARLALKQPLFGWGPYSFRFVQPHLQAEVLATSDHPHNVFLKYAMERGFIAALLLAAAFAWTFIVGLKRAIRLRNAEGIPLEIFLIVAIAGVLAHNLIDYNLQFVGIALPMWLGIGILSVGQKPKENQVNRYGMMAVAIFLLFCTLSEGTNLFLSSRARRADARGDVYSALRWYGWARSSLFPRDAKLAEGAILLALNQLPEAEAAVDASLTENEQDARAWRLLGDIYLRWDKKEDALRAYEKAYNFGRMNDIGITRGLVTLLNAVDVPTLQERHLEFNKLINEFGLAIEQNTHFIALGKNVEDLVGLCDALARIFPEEAQAYKLLNRRVTDHAKEERDKIASRPRGLLW